jgi:hypothetical protein
MDPVKPPNGAAKPRMTGPPRRPGNYIGCPDCGRLLNIQWATRSIVCACGKRLTPTPAPEKPA